MYLINQFLKKIFYQFYVWGRSYYNPHLFAMYILSLLLTFNILGLNNLIYFLITKEALNVDMLIGFLLLASITFVIYLSYIRNKKYKMIFNEFTNVRLNEKKRIKYISIAYILFSILLFFGTAVIIGLYRNRIF